MRVPHERSVVLADPERTGDTVSDDEIRGTCQHGVDPTRGESCGWCQREDEERRRLHEAQRDNAPPSWVTPPWTPDSEGGEASP